MTNPDFQENQQRLLDALRLAHDEQLHAFNTWLAIRNAKSEEFESAYDAYRATNAEVNRLITALNALRGR